MISAAARLTHFEQREKGQSVRLYTLKAYQLRRRRVSFLSHVLIAPTRTRSSRAEKIALAIASVREYVV